MQREKTEQKLFAYGLPTKIVSAIQKHKNKSLINKKIT